MTHSAAVSNPFLLLLNPEVVLAAIAKSEHLSQLNRHLCRPLDKGVPAASGSRAAEAEIEIERNDQSDLDSEA